MCSISEMQRVQRVMRLPVSEASKAPAAHTEGLSLPESLLSCAVRRCILHNPICFVQRVSLVHSECHVQAMREGSIQQLDKCIKDNQFRFIQAGTFLLVEKLKLYVHRRLFKRVALLHREQDSTKAERLPLGVHLSPPLSSERGDPYACVYSDRFEIVLSACDRADAIRRIPVFIPSCGKGIPCACSRTD